MISFFKNKKKYPVINEPISRDKYIRLLEENPSGFYLSNGKRLKLCTDNSSYKKFDINIDFFNMLKLFGGILVIFYFFVVKRKVTKAINENSVDTESYLNNLVEELEKNQNIAKKKAKKTSAVA